MEMENDAGGEMGFLGLISAECLDTESRSGQPQALSEEEKDHLIAKTKRDWGARHLSLTGLQLEAGLGQSTTFLMLCTHGKLKLTLKSPSLF